jgi:purine-binding chemotaxis protein CheW
MNHSSKQQGTLVDQQQALGVYLDALLREPEPVTQTAIQTPEAPVTVELAPRPVAAEATAPPVEAPAAAPAAVAATPPPELDGPPEWARNGKFQCLLFKVWGLTLSVPLVKLYGVLTWPESMTPVFGHARWFIGLARNQERNVQVMDTAHLVLPPHKLSALQAAEERNFHNIILIDEGRCGLACDEIGEVISLDADDVQWRSAQGKRPWLAGTVKQHMCALLEVDEFIRMIGSIRNAEDLRQYNE